jgi:hypothetical protein
MLRCGRGDTVTIGCLHILGLILDLTKCAELSTFPHIPEMISLIHHTTSCTLNGHRDAMAGNNWTAHCDTGPQATANMRTNCLCVSGPESESQIIVSTHISIDKPPNTATGSRPNRNRSAGSTAPPFRPFLPAHPKHAPVGGCRLQVAAQGSRHTATPAAAQPCSHLSHRPLQPNPEATWHTPAAALPQLPCLHSLHYQKRNLTAAFCGQPLRTTT